MPILAKYASEGHYRIQTEDHVETTWEQVDVKEWEDDAVEIDMCNKIAKKLVAVVKQKIFL